MTSSRFGTSLRGLGVPFQLLFVSGVLSDIGGFSTVTALQVHVARLTNGNPTYMGLIAIATLVPMLFASPIGGVWAEKYDRRMVMVTNDVVRIPIVLLMVTTESVGLLLLLHAANCASTALFMPSRQSLIPDLVPNEHLLLANSLLGGVISVVHMLGPPLGVFLYQTLGGLWGVVLVEAVAYLLSALLLFRLPNPAQRVRMDQTTQMWEEVRAGFRYVIAEPDLRQIFVILLTAGAAMGLLLPLLLPFVQQVLHGTERDYAALIFWFGFGGMVGPFIGHWLGRSLGLGKTLLLCSITESLLLTIWSRVDRLPVSTGLLVLWGIEVFALIPCYTSYLHTYARKEFMGRTFALFDQAVYVPQILSAVIVVVWGNRLPTQALLTVAGVVYFSILLLTLWSRGARKLMASGSSAVPAYVVLAHDAETNSPTPQKPKTEPDNGQPASKTVSSAKTPDT